MIGSGRSRNVVAWAGMVMVAAALAAMPARAQQSTTDCLSYAGNPAPGTPEWDARDQNNIYCAIEGYMNYHTNPAQEAANAANVAGGSALYRGDPFREPVLRWGGVRGETLQVNWTNNTGRVSDGFLLSPPASQAGPFPGIIIPCHSCFTSAIESGVYWAAEVLAEAGYLVFVPYSGGNDIDSTIAATDYLVATPDTPTANDEFNPWWARLDRTRLGIAGHSGAGGLALNVGHTDPRYSAVVAFDPAGPGIAGLDLQTPTMVQTADYQGNTSALITPLLPDGTEVPLPLPLPLLTFLPYGPNTTRDDYPTPAPGSRYTFFDTLRDAGVDAMQVGIRAATHIDFGRPGGGTFSTYGEMVASYYSLAWFDRYLRGANDPVVALDARRRLTSISAFDGSVDVHSIGTGFFDPAQAAAGDSDEAGNVPFAIEGFPICNRISFYYPTRYSLEGGSLYREDLRAACPDADLDGITNDVDSCPVDANAGQEDGDGDGRGDICDNCLFVANPGQEDSGGITTTEPDDIGDACQCGDVTGNGIVNGQDANAIKRHALGAEPNPLFAVPGNCDVSGNGECNGQDANAVKRAALGQSNPLFGQNCHNAIGAPVPPDL